MNKRTGQPRKSRYRYTLAELAKVSRRRPRTNKRASNSKRKRKGER